MANEILGQLTFCDVIDGGAYRIADTVTRLGVAGKYRVWLFSRFSGRLIAETWSADDGAYAFDLIALRQNGYFVVAFDHTAGALKNAAIADLITPEPMP